MVWDKGSRIWGIWSRVTGLEFRISVVRFRGQGPELRIYNAGF
jgi:hypothetical protein